MPSSSARCAQLPRAADKVPFYLALKKLRDHLNGDLPTLDESEVVFPVVDHKPKSEVKDDVTDEDDDSRMSLGDSPKEMTLEQIQMQAEYLEALAASAEGKDIPMENWGNGKQKCKRLLRGDNSIDTEASGSGDESSLPYTPQIYNYKSDLCLPQSQPTFGISSLDLDLKQEVPYDASEYGVVAVNGPVAQKVNYEINGSESCQSSPQYLSLGETTVKKGTFTSIKSSHNFPPSPSSQMQHSSSSYNPPQYCQGRVPYFSQTMSRISTQHNGSNFTHFQSRTNGKDTKQASYLNI